MGGAYGFAKPTFNQQAQIYDAKDKIELNINLNCSGKRPILMCISGDMNGENANKLDSWLKIFY